MTTPWTTPRALCGLMVGLFVLAVWGIGVAQTVSAQIGAGSCSTGYAVCDSFAGDTIGNDSCNGDSACNGAQGNVGANSCNGEFSCQIVQGSVGANSCNGEKACIWATADIGDCQNNTVSVPACDDTDDDDVTDDKDTCPNTPAEARVNADGCAIDQLCPCAHRWKTHGQYVSCVDNAAEDFVAADLLTDEDKDVIVSEAAQSSCSKKK